MKPQLLAIALATVVSAALAGCQRSAPDDTASAEPTAPAATATTEPATSTPSKSAPTDLEQLAQRLVTQSAAVKEGEVVFISGRVQDAELMENIAVNVRKAGGFPLITYSSDRLAKRLFFDVPEQYDSQADALGMKLADLVDVNISLGNGMTENLFEGADPKRMAARGKADEPVSQAFLKNNVRNIDIGNNLYPTPWRAERYGMAEDELAQAFWNGVNLDYTELQTRGEQVKAALAAGKEVHITNPNGTDLKVQVRDARSWSATASSPTPIARPAAPRSRPTCLQARSIRRRCPAPPKARSCTPAIFFRGKQIDNLTLDAGRRQGHRMTGAGPGFADFKAAYDAVDDARKDLFGFVDLGINPNVKLASGSTVGTWVPAGTVTVGTGGNTWAGGDNSVPFGTTIYLPGSTVMLDGKAIVENGVLKL